MIDIIYDGIRYRQKRIDNQITKAVETVFGMCGVSEYTVTVMLTGDNRMRDINRKQRSIDKTTDVLSFPATDDFKGDSDEFFGDIVISLPKARRQARTYGQHFLKEITFLTIHGSLHLLGYDHIYDAQEKKMRKAQREAIARIEE